MQLLNRQKISFLVVISILLLAVFRGESNSAETEYPFSRYKEGLALFKAGEFIAAAEYWVKTGELFLKESRDIISLRRAGLANLLATIAFERADDARAYVTWSTAVRYFLEGQTNWEEQREKIRNIINRIQTQLKATAIGGPLISLKDEDIVALDLEDTLSLSTYKGPAPGLKVRTPQESGIRINVSRYYYPRPLIVPREEGPGEERVISGNLGNFEKQETSSKPSYPQFLGRGIPIPPETTKESTPPSPTPEQTQPLVFLERHIVPLPRTTDTSKTPPVKAEKGEAERTLERSSQKVFLPRMEEFLPKDFSKKEMDIALTAWQYFVFNYQPNTGLVNAVHNYPFATLWDMASSLAAFISAEKLGLISIKEFKEKVTRFLETMLTIDLYNNELPNREYDTRTGRMTDLRNRPSYKGSGWSASDIGRFLIWLKIAEEWYPGLKDLINKVKNRWQCDRVCMNKELNGVFFDGKKEYLRQEGRLGYEQYAAAGFYLWGYDVSRALDYEEIEWTDIMGIKIPYDTRENAYLTSEPFMLSKMELGGIDEEFNRLINNIYQVQKKRWEEQGILTAATEDSINQKPWFIYNCIFYNGKPWVCVDHRGHERPELRNLSTKAAIAWSSIYTDDYARRLRNAVISLRDPRYGFYGGIFENRKINKSKNVNTNAIILEAMLYLKRGRKPFLVLKNVREQNR